MLVYQVAFTCELQRLPLSTQTPATPFKSHSRASCNIRSSLAERKYASFKSHSRASCNQFVMRELRKQEPFKSHSRASCNEVCVHGREGKDPSSRIHVRVATRRRHPRCSLQQPSSRIHVRVATRAIQTSALRCRPSSRIHVRVATEVAVFRRYQRLLQVAFTCELQHLAARTEGGLRIPSSRIHVRVATSYRR